MSYYTRWGLVIGTPIFQRFLRENYVKGVSDLDTLKRTNPLTQQDATCLLCGVGNKETAQSFIEFALKQNPKAHIIIIDLGAEQIDKVDTLVRKEFAQYNITVKQINALNLTTWLDKSSIDWIETDGFLEFFLPSDLSKLLSVWHTILKEHGFITIREPASSTTIGSILDQLRVSMAKWWLGIRIYIHTLENLQDLFERAGLMYVSSPTVVPTFRRFTLVKK